MKPPRNIVGPGIKALREARGPTARCQMNGWEIRLFLICPPFGSTSPRQKGEVGPNEIAIAPPQKSAKLSPTRQCTLLPWHRKPDSAPTVINDATSSSSIALTQ